MLEQNNIITLSNDQDYMVIYTTKINNEEYSYMINMNNDEDSMVCKVLNNDIEVITDEKMINLFLKKFAEENLK